MKTQSIIPLFTITMALCGMLRAAPVAVIAGPDTLDAHDTSFIERAAADNLAKLKLAELGVKKAVAPAVKAYAAALVADHTKTGHTLFKLATTKSVELIGLVEPGYALVLKSLANSDAASFDGNFLARMEGDQKACLANFEKAAKDAKNADVKTFATGMLPKIHAQLKTAAELGTVSITSK